MSDRGQSLRLGLITDEHNGLPGSRAGGFGWATQAAAGFFRGHPELGVAPEIICCLRTFPDTPRPAEIDGVPLHWRRQGRIGFFQEPRPAFDLLLSIDYRANYRIAFAQWPRTPAIVWARDPFGPDDVVEVAGLSVPGEPHEARWSYPPPRHETFRSVWRWSRACGRTLRIGAVEDFLAARVPHAYRIAPPRVSLLPNPLIHDVEPGPRPPRPLVLFLGRLDPVKRPWLFVELARSFPEVDFVLAGKPTPGVPDTWRPAAISPNVRFAGQIGDAEKRRLLSLASVLVNTSVHEGLALSIQEGLSAGLPILGTYEAAGVLARFGIDAGRHPGDGWSALPALREGLTRLLGDEALRSRLGQAGQNWVRGRHNSANFLAAFRALAASVGRPLP